MFAEIWYPLLGGMAVFLVGMKTMELALHAWAGPYLNRFLHRSTRTPLHGMLFSSGMTALLQSSTAITVITIGLANAGLLSFSRSLGIILGTNVGTCLTTELIGLNISRYALPLLIGSLACWSAAVLGGEYRLLPKRLASLLHPLQFGSLAAAGFALILLGIEWMKQIGGPLQQRGMFTWFLERSNDSLLWALAAGVILTAVVHSSAAVIVMAMGLSAIGALPVEIGIAIVIGSNVGTCFTSLIASLGGSRHGHFVAWSHIALNVGGAILFYPLIGQLHALAAWLTADPAAQIARAQTVFNIASSVLALPLCYLKLWDRLR
ncbi:Na/Pi cotransporter family protein [Paenibacillus popilliae]|uniref:Na+/phosphate symporter n=1 Tax=Paenibacillus popilliae ATCC 14706 TaxID=1212764 RepID=M9M1Z8_PAEPP|nr:Na/Pi symporter [Paenibacillus popilliae]GAC42979.1 Na+/phosphate symporter [Paenibacillus popilliae ATCC 14706]